MPLARTSAILRGVLRGPLKDAAGSMLGRAVMLPISGVSSVLAAKLVIGTTGSEGFAVFSILVTLPALVPISDFGIAATVTDAAARFGLNSIEFLSAWRGTQRVLWRIAAVTTGLAGVGAVLGLWGPLLGLGPGSSTEIAAFVVVAAMAAGIPLGAAQRVLLGAGRGSLATVLVSSGPSVSLALVAVAWQLGGASVDSFAALYAFGPFSMQILLFVLARRTIARNRGFRTRESVDRLLQRPRAIVREAAPMAIIAVTIPLAIQSDRTLLAHTSTLDAVAQYALVAIFYAPLLSIISMGQQPLWPMFMRLIAEGHSIERPFYRALGLFAFLGCFLATGLVAVGPVLTRFVGSGAGYAGFSLFTAFAVMLIVSAVGSPAGMLLMDRRGRWLQAGGSVLMLASKVVLTFVLVGHLGAAAPVVATILATTACMLLPNLLFARRRIRDGNCVASGPARPMLIRAGARFTISKSPVKPAASLTPELSASPVADR